MITAAVTGTFPFILRGTLAGRATGMLTDHGVTNTLSKEIKHELKPGTSCLVIYGSSAPQRRPAVLDRLRNFAPTVLESDLPSEIEEALNKALHQRQGI